MADRKVRSKRPTRRLDCVDYTRRTPDCGLNYKNLGGHIDKGLNVGLAAATVLTALEVMQIVSRYVTQIDEYFHQDTKDFRKRDVFCC